MGYRPPCPECKSPLSFIVEKEEETGEINIVITCEWCEEYEGFMIKTGIKRRDLGKFTKMKEPFKIEMEIVPLIE